MPPPLFIAAVLCALIPLATARADDPNPEVAKAIQEIAARRAEKEEARTKQIEQWSKGEGRESRERNPAASRPKKDEVKK